MVFVTFKDDISISVHPCNIIYKLINIIELLFSPFSDPPLEEDDIPDGDWLCIECRLKAKDMVCI